MELNYVSARAYAVKLKATIHSSGKLGFTDETSRSLKLLSIPGVKFALDETGILYMTLCKKADDDCFKVCKAGAYYYVNAKALFDDKGYDYKNNSIIFDLTKIEEYKDTYRLNKIHIPTKLIVKMK